MFVELPQTLILATVGAFLIGWILSAISSRLGDKYRARRRDPRDDRIRALEAELRVAQTDATKSRENVEELESQLEELNEGIEKRDNVISHQQTKLEETTADLKESVIKTRELRSELSDRATENLKSEVKIREVETELEVARASTDLMATGVLDYSIAPEGSDEGDDDAEAEEDGDISKTAP